MNVRELIEILKGVNPDAQVMVYDNEWDCEYDIEVREILQDKIVLE